MPTHVPQTNADGIDEASDTLGQGRAALEARQHPELSQGGSASKATGPRAQEGIEAVKLPRPKKTYNAPYSREEQQWLSPQGLPHGLGKQARQESGVPDASMPHQSALYPRSHTVDKAADDREAESSFR